MIHLCTSDCKTFKHICEQFWYSDQKRLRDLKAELDGATIEGRRLSQEAERAQTQLAVANGTIAAQEEEIIWLKQQ